jgi:hypothetical protein
MLDQSPFSSQTCNYSHVRVTHKEKSVINSKAIIGSSPAQRAKMIRAAANITSTDDDISVARKLSGVINTFIDDYFQHAIQTDKNKSGGSILLPTNLQRAIQTEVTAFLPNALDVIRNTGAAAQSATVTSARNMYELAGATKLAAANGVTRTLSTTMGLLWERIANISPYALNPEIELGLKIVGIDLISKNINTGVIEYQQLKTQQNTLTGSQTKRSVAELSIHENPVFCACFAIANWTFSPNNNIPRVSGVEFWSRIGMNYSIVEKNVVNVIQELEKAFDSL